MAGDSIDEIILQRSSRGMEIVARDLPKDRCHVAARALLGCPRGVVGIATGFYVAGAAETDGPPGAHFLALGLRKLGFEPVILTDRLGSGLFAPGGLPVVEVAIQSQAHAAQSYREFADTHAPVALVSIERCGRAADGEYKNMRGVKISAHTAPIDVWFELARPDATTIAIGDGGNEIGMGNLAPIIRKRLGIDPCIVPVDHLVVATVSNWGAYGILAAMEHITGQPLLPTAAAIRSYLDHLVRVGCVDGMSGEPKTFIDGHHVDVEIEVVEELAALGRGRVPADATEAGGRRAPAIFPMSPGYEQGSLSQKDIGERVARRFGDWLHEQADLYGRPLPQSLLDIGCGPGNLTMNLPEWLRVPDLAVSGIDIDPEMIARARTRAPRVAFEVGDMYEAARCDRRFDAIFSNEVWHWMPEPPARYLQRSEVLYSFFPDGLKNEYSRWGHKQQRRSFTALSRRMAPDGVAVLQFGLNGQLEAVYEMLEQCVRRCVSTSPGLPFHLYYNCEEGIRRLVRRAGLEIVFFETAVEDLAETNPRQFVDFAAGFTRTHLTTVLGEERAEAVLRLLREEASDAGAGAYAERQWRRLVLGVRHFHGPRPA